MPIKVDMKRSPKYSWLQLYKVRGTRRKIDLNKLDRILYILFFYLLIFFFSFVLVFSRGKRGIKFAVNVNIYGSSHIIVFWITDQQMLLQADCVYLNNRMFFFDVSCGYESNKNCKEKYIIRVSELCNFLLQSSSESFFNYS